MFAPPPSADFEKLERPWRKGQTFTKEAEVSSKPQALFAVHQSLKHIILSYRNAGYFVFPSFTLARLFAQGVIDPV